MSLQTQPPPLEWPHYGISFSGAIGRGFKKYAKFEGRASRSEYWWWALFTGLVVTVLGLLSLVIGVQTSPAEGTLPGLRRCRSWCCWSCSIWPSWCRPSP